MECYLKAAFDATTVLGDPDYRAQMEGFHSGSFVEFEQRLGFNAARLSAKVSYPQQSKNKKALTQQRHRGKLGREGSSQEVLEKENSLEVAQILDIRRQCTRDFIGGDVQELDVLGLGPIMWKSSSELVVVQFKVENMFDLAIHLWD